MNDLYNQLMGSTPNQNQNPMIQQFINFRNNFNGDPKQMVQNLLNSGKMSQTQFNANYGYSRNMDNAGRYSRDANMNGTYSYGMSYPIRDYSYDNHNVMNELRAMLDSATSEKERSAISRCIESMSY